MRAIIGSDWHLDAVTHGVSRFNEVHRAIADMIAIAVNRKCNRFFFLGDLCDIDTLFTFKALTYVADTCRSLGTLGIKTYWMNGNHDSSNGVTIFDPFVSAYAMNGYHHFINAPRLIEDDDATLLFLPYLSHEVLSFNAIVKDLLQSSKRDKTVPVFVFSHMSVKGIPLGEESYEMARGGSHTVLPVDVLDTYRNASGRELTVFQGHYHKAQRFLAGNKVVVEVVGAPARFTYRETNHTPGYIILER